MKACTWSLFTVTVLAVLLGIYLKQSQDTGSQGHFNEYRFKPLSRIDSQNADLQRVCGPQNTHSTILKILQIQSRQRPIVVALHNEDFSAARSVSWWEARSPEHFENVRVQTTSSDFILQGKFAEFPIQAVQPVSDLHYESLTAGEFWEAASRPSKRRVYLTEQLSAFKDSDEMFQSAMDGLSIDVSKFYRKYCTTVFNEATAQQLEQRALSTAMVWVSQPGVVSQLHYDTDHNWFLQLAGTKRFVLFPPNVTQDWYPYSSLHPRRRYAVPSPPLSPSRLRCPLHSIPPNHDLTNSHAPQTHQHLHVSLAYALMP